VQTPRFATSFLALAPLAAALCLALAGGCGTGQKVPCLRSNCSGCCDVNNECQTGKELYACGSGASTCTSCAATGACQNGFCVAGDGGTSGPRDGGCSSANCNGCCDSNSYCRGGNTNTHCGVAGASCAACPVGQACNGNQCQVSTSCNGCVDGQGACQPGNNPVACGRDGGSCSACSMTQSCLQGQCTSSSCGPLTCNGCCDGTQCLTTGTNLKCGTGGNPCIACTSPATCQGGACATPPPPDAGSGTCGPSNCAGCCQGNVCKPGTSDIACGEAGDSCDVCIFFCLDKICFPI
jgi:hypothetical protein